MWCWGSMRTSVGLVGGVLVGDACCFQHEADKLAASRDAGPVEQFVGWMSGFLLVGGHFEGVAARCIDGNTSSSSREAAVGQE